MDWKTKTAMQKAFLQGMKTKIRDGTLIFFFKKGKISLVVTVFVVNVNLLQRMNNFAQNVLASHAILTMINKVSHSNKITHCEIIINSN